MLAEPVGDDDCSLARRWVLEPGLAAMLVAMEGLTRRQFAAAGVRWPGLWIISGYRSPADQARVNPALKNSLHVRCPSLAVDLRVGQVAGMSTPEIWRSLGNVWRAMGGRWGGDFKDSQGLPAPDVNHFDLGFSFKAGPPGVQFDLMRDDVHSRLGL